MVGVGGVGKSALVANLMTSAAQSEALLIEADFGEFPELRRVSSTQHKVRTLLIALIDYEISKLPERRTPPDRGVLRRLVPLIDEVAEENSELGDLVREILALSHDSEGVAFLVAGLAMRVPTDEAVPVSISSSVTVNPWQEIVQAVAPTVLWGAGGTAAIAAIKKAFQHMPEIIDNIVQLTLIRGIREVQLAELEAQATKHRNEALLDVIHTANEITVARRVRDAILELSADDVRNLQVRPISDEEATERRLRIVRSLSQDEDQ